MIKPYRRSGFFLGCVLIYIQIEAKAPKNSLNGRLVRDVWGPDPDQKPTHVWFPSPETTIPDHGKRSRCEKEIATGRLDPWVRTVGWKWMGTRRNGRWKWRLWDGFEREWRNCLKLDEKRYFDQIWTNLEKSQYQITFANCLGNKRRSKVPNLGYQICQNSK